MGHKSPNSSTAECNHALIVSRLPNGRTHISKAMLAKIIFSLREASHEYHGWVVFGMADDRRIVSSGLWSVSVHEILVTRTCIR